MTVNPHGWPRPVASAADGFASLFEAAALSQTTLPPLAGFAVTALIDAPVELRTAVAFHSAPSSGS